MVNGKKLMFTDFHVLFFILKTEVHLTYEGVRSNKLL